MPRGWHREQGPRHPIRAAASYATAHPWQLVDCASNGVTYTPLVDPWIEQLCCGDSECIRTAVEQKIVASSAPGGEPAERGLPVARLPILQPHGVVWVPGADPGTFDSSPWLLDRFLAQLGDDTSFCFKHYQDSLSVCDILVWTGWVWAWAACYLSAGLPTLDDYKLFCQDLEEVIQDPHSFAEYRAAVPWALPLPLALSQPPVAPRLPAVRQLARFSEALAFNMGAPPGPVPAALATPAVFASNSASRNALPEQQLAKKNSPGPVEHPALSDSAGGTDSIPVGPTSQLEEIAPVLPESAKPLAQHPHHPGGPAPQKTGGF
ncbi:LOW QUALITY PROTEIN: protein Bop [Trichechus inunguis]